jgi:hypothetical protein
MGREGPKGAGHGIFRRGRPGVAGTVITIREIGEIKPATMQDQGLAGLVGEAAPLADFDLELAALEVIQESVAAELSIEFQGEVGRTPPSGRNGVSAR